MSKEIKYTQTHNKKNKQQQKIKALEIGNFYKRPERDVANNQQEWKIVEPHFIQIVVNTKFSNAWSISPIPERLCIYKAYRIDELFRIAEGKKLIVFFFLSTTSFCSGTTSTNTTAKWARTHDWKVASNGQSNCGGFKCPPALHKILKNRRKRVELPENAIYQNAFADDSSTNQTKADYIEFVFRMLTYCWLAHVLIVCVCVVPKRCLFTWATLPMQTSTLHKTLPCHVSYDKFAWIFAHNNATIYLSGHSTVCRPHIMLHYWASANIYITFLNCVQIQFRSILFCVVFFFAFTLLFFNFQLSYVFNGLCKIVCVSDNWVFLFPFFVTFCASHQHSGNIRLSVIRTMTAN